MRDASERGWRGDGVRLLNRVLRVASFIVMTELEFTLDSSPRNVHERKVRVWAGFRGWTKGSVAPRFQLQIKKVR